VEKTREAAARVCCWATEDVEKTCGIKMAQALAEEGRRRARKRWEAEMGDTERGREHEISVRGRPDEGIARSGSRGHRGRTVDGTR
jgi:hypothetical protein